MIRQHKFGVWCHVLILIVGIGGLGFMMSESGLATSVLTNPQQETERRVWDEGLLKKRPTAKKKAARPRPTYKFATAPLPATLMNSKEAGKATHQERIIGFTLWRTRAAQPGDEARLLIHNETTQKTAEETPERIRVDEILEEGQHVRITIESPNTGYLYVIDREKYADGSCSDPYLIFPTTRLNAGDNRVTAGRLIEIPSLTDNPPYLTVHKNRNDHIGELITVIVSEKPLDIQITRNFQKLPSAQVAEWEKRWNAPFARIDQVEGPTPNWTKAEQEAGQNTSRLLKQDDPLPQCIFCIAVKPGDPLLLTFDLRYSKGK